MGPFSVFVELNVLLYAGMAFAGGLGFGRVGATSDF